MHACVHLMCSPPGGLLRLSRQHRGWLAWVQVIMLFPRVFWDNEVEFINRISKSGFGPWQEWACAEKATGKGGFLTCHASVGGGFF